jgi:hypothetical protein
MPISRIDGYDSDHLTVVYDYLIKPAIEKAGFEPTRADKSHRTELIVFDIYRQIIESEMVLCDISSKNPNVMYELGIRHALDLPVTVIKDDKTSDIFDIKDIRYIEYDHKIRIDNALMMQDEIAKNIKTTYEGKLKSPESHYLSPMSMLKYSSVIVEEEPTHNKDDQVNTDDEYSNVGYVEKWIPEKNIGIINSESQEYFVGTNHLVHSKLLIEGKKVYFLPGTNVRNEKNPPAFCVLMVGDTVEGIVRWVHRERYFGFAEVSDLLGNTRRIYVEKPFGKQGEELGDFIIGARVMFEVAIKEKGVRGVNTTILD